MTESRNGQSLTIKDLKAATGLSISTLRRRVKDGSIPVVQLGGPGKKLLFPATVIDTLCKQRAGQVGLNTGNNNAARDNTGLLPHPPTASPSVEANGTRSILDGIARPDTGSIPNWMRSPLLTKTNQSKPNSRTIPCQDNAKTN